MKQEYKEKLESFAQKNKIILGALAVAVIASSAATMVTFADEQRSSNYDDDEHRGGHFHEMDEDERAEHREEMKEKFEEARVAVKNNDFEAWQDALEDHPKGEEFATQEKFDILVQAHELREAGDEDAAKELLKDSGLHPHGKRAFGKFKGGEKHGEMKEIMENGDYDAWAEKMSEKGHIDESLITPENFERLQQAHELHVEGDHDAAREIMQDVFGEDWKPKHPRGEHGDGEMRAERFEDGERGERPQFEAEQQRDGENEGRPNFRRGPRQR